MGKDRRIITSIIYVALGAVLFALGLTEVVDAFWSSMGSALIAVGIIRGVRFIRLCRDEAYREKVETEINDERNLFIRNKAWAWSGYLFILIAAVATIALRIAGQELLSTAAAFSVCLILVLYWICWLILSKKY